MKTLILVRHAKSSWKDLALADVDRPLNKRGNRNAPKMSAHLYGMGFHPDLVVSSPSQRTLETAAYFKVDFKWPDCQLQAIDLLYHGDVQDINEVLQTIDSRINTVLLFGHNPGITDYVNQECQYTTSNVPTCGVVVCSVNVPDWKQFVREDKTVFYAMSPKELERKELAIKI